MENGLGPMHKLLSAGEDPKVRKLAQLAKEVQAVVGITHWGVGAEIFDTLRRQLDEAGLTEEAKTYYFEKIIEFIRAAVEIKMLDDINTDPWAGDEV